MRRQVDRPTCFARERDKFGNVAQDPLKFANDTKFGVHCKTNWYEGTVGLLGQRGSLPYFSNAVAPAVLGFDEDIDGFCGWEREHFQNSMSYFDTHAGGCVNANHNILSLYGDRVPYNLCRNLEWQVCASRGLLPGQGGRVVRFARQPSDLSVHGEGGYKALGRCGGWRPPDVDGDCSEGFATDDIFFLEVCVFSFICMNVDGDDGLFRIPVGSFFECQFSPERFDELMGLLLEDPNEPTVDSRPSPPERPPPPPRGPPPPMPPLDPPEAPGARSRWQFFGDDD